MLEQTICGAPQSFPLPKANGKIKMTVSAVTGSVTQCDSDSDCRDDDMNIRVVVGTPGGESS